MLEDSTRMRVPAASAMAARQREKFRVISRSESRAIRVTRLFHTSHSSSPKAAYPPPVSVIRPR